MFSESVCVETPHASDAYSVLYKVSNWWEEKSCWRRHRKLNFLEADLAREEICDIQLRVLVKDSPRMFNVEEGDWCVSLKQRK